MIEVGEMVIKIPGIEVSEATQIGETIAGRIVDLLPGEVNEKQIPELNVKINYSPGSSNEELANDIAERVTQQLKFM